METAQEKIGEQLGNYRLVRETGRGATSTVYEAVDTRMGRTIALKVGSMPSHLSAEAQGRLVGRLKREARSVARLSHPNIVTIHDVGEHNGHHYIVMEYLTGETLRERLDKGPLPPADAAAILDQIAAGLDVAHTQGIVHRDIKPSNVMLLPGGHVKVMDFGLARQADETMVTQDGMMVGSPAYMAPEQVRGEVTRSSDLWALGVLLYEMLAGRPPFVAENVLSVLYQVAHDEPPALPGTSAEVQRVLRRAMAKEPEKRFGSAGELAAAFRRAVAGGPGAQAAAAGRARPRPDRAQPVSQRLTQPLWPLLARVRSAAATGVFHLRRVHPIVWAVVLLAVIAAALPPSVRNRVVGQARSVMNTIRSRSAAVLGGGTSPSSPAVPKPPSKEKRDEEDALLKKRLEEFRRQQNELRK